MTAATRVERDARRLLLAVSAGTALWAFAALLAWLLIFAVFDLLLGLPAGVRVLAWPLGIFIAAAVSWIWWRRGRAARSPREVALWIEGHVPALRYALATLLDDRLAPNQFTARLEGAVAEQDWSDLLARAMLRAWMIPVAVLAISAASLALMPAASLARVARPRPGDVLGRPLLGGRGSILSPLVATVTPPAYTDRRPDVVEEPVMLTGIAGSRIQLEGNGNPDRLRAVLGDSSVSAESHDDRWRVSIRMPESPVALRLSDGPNQRLVTIEPYPDSAPVVTLHRPARDTVLRTASGSIPLSAALSDDIGLADGRFEYIITSGEMEAFTFRAGVIGHRAMNGARRDSMTGVLALGSLNLKPGDIIHVRAVASDGNTVSGPGRGASETRTIRIARQGEYDTVDVETLPSMLGDTAALSERMLIMLAETLEHRRPHLAHDSVTRESRSIGVDQARLRRRVADVVFMRISGESSAEESEGDTSKAMTPEQVLAAAESAATRAAGNPLDFSEDESPVVAVNRPLLEAYNAMWDAGRALEIGEPGQALPHMRAALAAIQRARLAERIYLRGRPATQVVDLRDARLKGDRAGAGASSRAAGPASGLEKSRLAARLETVIALAAHDPLAAADSLLLLRLSSLGGYPDFARAAGRAAADLRGGGSAVADLVRARESLVGAARPAEGLGAWSTAP